ncbi:MAG: ectoine hydroxylase, partial [Hyphomonas sp.]|nr:ectoine hydroxylase [Hyphomonas sp.]
MDSELIPDLYPSRRGAQPDWLERHDPVVQGLPGRAPPIDQAMIDGFVRDGFAVLEDVFSTEEVRGLVAEARALRNQSGL